MQIKKIKKFKYEDLENLFASVNWKSAENPKKLVKAFKYASHVISVWENNILIGIIRSMDDNCWSANIDCLVVHKDFQNKGYGKLLLTELLKELENIEYINVCPDDKSMEKFYLSFGFKIVEGFYLQKINSL